MFCNPFVNSSAKILRFLASLARCIVSFGRVRTKASQGVKVRMIGPWEPLKDFVLNAAPKLALEVMQHGKLRRKFHPDTPLVSGLPKENSPRALVLVAAVKKRPIVTQDIYSRPPYWLDLRPLVMVYCHSNQAVKGDARSVFAY